jgi:hypothetical protein
VWRYPVRLLDRPERLDGNFRLKRSPFTPVLPVGAGGLPNVEVGNLDSPPGLGVFTRYQTSESALPYPAFLRHHADLN